MLVILVEACIGFGDFGIRWVDGKQKIHLDDECVWVESLYFVCPWMEFTQMIPIEHVM